MVTLGFYLPRWMRSDYPKLTGAGLFDAESFDPPRWKGAFPNPAFMRMDREDAFWAAKQVAAFTDDEIRAIVETGELSDPRAADWLTKCLIQRRDRIVAAWFAQVLPLDHFRITEGRLAFDDLAAIHSPGAAREYTVQWARYDNERGVGVPLPAAIGRKVPDTAGTAEYLSATIGCSNAAKGECPNPATVYLRRTGESSEVVGIDR